MSIELWNKQIADLNFNFFFTGLQKQKCDNDNIQEIIARKLYQMGIFINAVELQMNRTSTPVKKIQFCSEIAMKIMMQREYLNRKRSFVRSKEMFVTISLNL